MVRIELLPDFLQEAGEENCIGTIHLPRPHPDSGMQPVLKILRGCVCMTMQVLLNPRQQHSLVSVPQTQSTGVWLHMDTHFR